MRTTRLLRNYRLRVLVCVLASVCNLARLPTQTVEVVGSAGAAVNARVPVSDYAGNVFYVNGDNEVIGNPTTPIVEPFLSPVSFLAPGADDAVPYFLSCNGNVVTCITTRDLIQSNDRQKIMTCNLARPLRRAIQELQLDPLATKLRWGGGEPDERIKVTATDQKMFFQKKCTAEIRRRGLPPVAPNATFTIQQRNRG